MHLSETISGKQEESGILAKLTSDKVIDGLSRDIAGLPVLNPIVKAAVEAAPCETDGDVADDAAGDVYLSQAASMHQAAPASPAPAHVRLTPLSSFMHNLRDKATEALNQSRTLLAISEYMPRKILLQAFHAIRSVAAQALAESGVFQPDITMGDKFDYGTFAKAVKFNIEYPKHAGDKPKVAICVEELCVDVEDLKATDSDEVWGVPTTIDGTWEAVGLEAKWTANLYEFVMVKGRRVAAYEVCEA